MLALTLGIEARGCDRPYKLKARTHRDEYRRALFAIFADDEPSEHANSFPDIRWRLM